jgi:hypothetical protein
MKTKHEDQLKIDIEKGLRELLGGKSTKTEAEKNELRANLKLAMQFRAIESKIGDEEYGSGFSNGDDKRVDDDD